MFGFLTVDQVNLSLKVKVFSLLACFVSVYFSAFLTAYFTLAPEYPILIASMGASAVILYLVPGSTLAQPWPFVAGQLGSGAVGVLSALYVQDLALAAALAVAGSVGFMLFFRCLHPPGTATSLAPVLADDSIRAMAFDFVLQPLAFNVFFMLLFAVLINRWLLARPYPGMQANSKQLFSVPLLQLAKVGIRVSEVEQAVKEMDIYVDTTYSDISFILNHIENNRYKAVQGSVCCKDIMSANPLALEFGSDIEEAWEIMNQKNLKAIPVIDKARRVIGLVTRHDFFKFIDMSVYNHFQDNFRAFIRKSMGISSQKPESVGQIMSHRVKVVQQDAHISELIPLMTNEGYDQVPIVNGEHRLVGMVYQTNLIAGFYHSSLAENRLSKK